MLDYNPDIFSVFSSQVAMDSFFLGICVCIVCIVFILFCGFLLEFGFDLIRKKMGLPRWRLFAEVKSEDK